jgi:hypothetical protein
VPARGIDASAMSTDASTTARSPWQRLHQALMPDYNRKATIYWWAMVLLGSVAHQ